MKKTLEKNETNSSSSLKDNEKEPHLIELRISRFTAIYIYIYILYIIIRVVYSMLPKYNNVCVTNLS